MDAKLFVDSQGMDERGDGEALLTEIINHLKIYYQPAVDLADCDMHISTQEVYNRLQALYPSPWYSAAFVAECLKQLGYRWIDIGNMRFEWLIKKQG